MYYTLSNVKSEELFRSGSLEELHEQALLEACGRDVKVYYIDKRYDDGTPREGVTVVTMGGNLHLVERLPLEDDILRRELRAPEPEDIVWVNVYDVVDEYGGPEEGGWWYTKYTHLEGTRCREEFTPEIVEGFEKEFGDEVEIKVEKSYAASETRTRPFYS